MSEEFEHERIRGLPGPLPSGERILWRGFPRWTALAWRVFHVREAIVWFALIGIARAVADLANGAAMTSVVWEAAILVPICLAACALLAGMAWASARTTIYTVTDQRVVMRIGIALPLTVNVPYGKIAAASARLDPLGAGDVGLRLGDGSRLAWLVLWPHCRPWRVRSPEPTMRAVSDGARLANILSEALAAAVRDEGGAAVRTGMPAVPGNNAAPAMPSPEGLGAAV